MDLFQDQYMGHPIFGSGMRLVQESAILAVIPPPPPTLESHSRYAVDLQFLVLNFNYIQYIEQHYKFKVF